MLFDLVSPVGVEPTANRLKVGCSTTELQALTKMEWDRIPF